MKQKQVEDGGGVVVVNSIVGSGWERHAEEGLWLCISRGDGKEEVRQCRKDNARHGQKNPESLAASPSCRSVEGMGTKKRGCYKTNVASTDSGDHEWRQHVIEAPGLLTRK